MTGVFNPNGGGFPGGGGPPGGDPAAAAAGAPGAPPGGAPPGGGAFGAGGGGGRGGGGGGGGGLGVNNGPGSVAHWMKDKKPGDKKWVKMTPQSMAREVRITVLHELGHHLGLDEEQLTLHGLA